MKMKAIDHLCRLLEEDGKLVDHRAEAFIPPEGENFY